LTKIIYKKHTKDEERSINSFLICYILAGWRLFEPSGGLNKIKSSTSYGFAYFEEIQDSGNAFKKECNIS